MLKVWCLQESQDFDDDDDGSVISEKNIDPSTVC